MEPEEQEERDTFVPESARLILVPALKFGALCGESRVLAKSLVSCVSSNLLGYFSLFSQNL